MKKLRCENCNGELKIEDNNEYAYCNYCRTRYKLNEDKTVVFKIDDSVKDVYESTTKMITPIALVISVMIFIFAILFGIGVYKLMGGGKPSEYEIRSYNSELEMYKGTQSKFFIDYLIDDIVERNSKNKRQITVEYNDISTSNVDEISDLKNKLDKYFYEIKFEYDSKGFINKTIITDTK